MMAYEFDEMVDQRREHEEFHYDSAAEVDRDDAALAGSRRPNQDWILSDRDVWYSNPYYDAATYGPRGPHPEDFGREEEVGITDGDLMRAYAAGYDEDQVDAASGDFVPVAYNEDECPF
jgi:hypothetical protein